ncbi:MAG: ComF family protein [Terrimonas sp.]|nr:ComF family protein [Terrimonas sp.]
MQALKTIQASLLQLIFPHVCSGCGSDLLPTDSSICFQCLEALPETNFIFHANNPVEKIFWGRLPLVQAAAQYYFTKESLIQQLMHELKYRGNRNLGLQLGRLMGLSLLQTNRFNDIDALVPLPLYPARERKRGYNQAALLCEGITAVTGIPILNNIVSRPQPTVTQTQKTRIERWQNIAGKFRLDDPDSASGKHLLLIDDVVTTGTTLEACGQELLKIGNGRLSIATLCYTAH